MGLVLPSVMVLKLTQRANDPNAPGAVYDHSTDRMIINHWTIVRALYSRLPSERFAKISARLSDAKQLSKLITEDPSLLPIIVDEIDVTYFHELKHAEQSRRNRLDDELLRGNLPGVNPLSKEHEAHREHCRYLLSKSAEAIVRSGWRDYCLDLIKDPAAFKNRVTSMYYSTFSGSATLDDLAARQDARRRTSRALETGGVKNWISQKLKQRGYDTGDSVFATYKNDAEKREKKFILDELPSLRRQSADKLVAHHQARGEDNLAFNLAAELPADSLTGGEARIAELADKTVAWVIRNAEFDGINDRLVAIDRISSRLKDPSRKNWPPGLEDAYERDARAMAEDFIIQALKAPSREREQYLDWAKAWAASLREPQELLARISDARPRPHQ
jgi:hypothetical protein